MIYLYAHTNHKEDLDSLRRVKVIYDALKKEGIEAEILVNEYRAQLLGKEWGLPPATTIETIKDIDAVAKIDDIVLIDSKEELEGKVLNYPEYFKKVIYINSSCENIDYSGAKVIDLFINNQVIAPKIKQNDDKQKAIFIYGDSDFEKRVLENLDKFSNLDIDIDFYWGIYFFVKYEDIIKKSFNYIVESEDYYEILQNYNIIVTSNAQVAIDALINRKSVYFLNLKETKECLIKLIQQNGAKVINNSDSINLATISLKDEVKLTDISSLITTIINDYM